MRLAPQKICTPFSDRVEPDLCLGLGQADGDALLV